MIVHWLVSLYTCQGESGPSYKAVLGVFIPQPQLILRNKKPLFAAPCPLYEQPSLSPALATSSLRLGLVNLYNSAEAQVALAIVAEVPRAKSLEIHSPRPRIQFNVRDLPQRAQ